ncbi:hypothetical protein Tco_0772147 [Tanacetum coccineum]|uniref:Uncharacterized protein n=1 Tax=Tanacetum coccineum TaxID=301880 RepID=A0ABQ4ZIG1_9ASTR
MNESVEKGQSQLLTSSDETSEMLSDVVSQDDNENNAEVHIKKEHHTSLGSNLHDNADYTVEMEKVKKEIKAMEAELLGTATQAQERQSNYLQDGPYVTPEEVAAIYTTTVLIEEYDVFSIVYEPVHGIIYTNSKKEKRVMRHSEIHKFCDATLRRTLEGLKSYYNDVKYGYVQKELTNDEVEFLKLFEEEIEVRLNYRDQMRRWEMYVNGRPLGPRRERPE